MSKFLSPVTTWLPVPHMCTWWSISESPPPALWEQLSLYHPLAEMTQKGRGFNDEFNLLSHLGRRKNPPCWGFNMVKQFDASAVVGALDVMGVGGVLDSNLGLGLGPGHAGRL